MCHTAWSTPMSGTTVVTPLDVCGSRHPRPLEPAFDLGLGRRPPGPRLLIYHHGLAGLDRLVHLEEVPNLELQKAVQVGDVLEVRQPVSPAGTHNTLGVGPSSSRMRNRPIARLRTTQPGNVGSCTSTM